MTQWRVARLVALAAVALIVAGCAERQSKSQYEDALVRLHAGQGQVINELKERDVADVEWFDDAQQRMRRAADDLEAIQPPKQVEAAHRRHLEGLRGLARLLGRLGDCARLASRDRQAGESCRSNIDQLEIDEVRNDLAEADAIYEAEGFRVR